MITGNGYFAGRHLYTAGRILLGAVFIYASWGKVFNPVSFAEVIANYQILPRSMVVPVALILPWIELVCGVSLIVNRWVQGGALLVSCMLVVFIGALGYNAYRGIDVACGCFTLDETAPSGVWFNLARNGGLLAVALYVLRGDARQFLKSR